MAVSPPIGASFVGSGARPFQCPPCRPWSGHHEGEDVIAEPGSNGRAIPLPVNVVPDEVDLARRLRARDSTALAALYDRHAAAVFGLARSILRDPRLAEEVTHDVFLGLWQRPDTFDARRGSFSAWLLRVARNRAIDLLRRQREQPFISPVTHDGATIDPMERLVDPDPDPADQALGRVVQEDVRGALVHLSPDHAHLLQLAYFEGLTQREIASHLQRPLGTVKSQIRAAMKHLADLLAGPPPLAVEPPHPARSAGPVGPGQLVRRHVTEDPS